MKLNAAPSPNFNTTESLIRKVADTAFSLDMSTPNTLRDFRESHTVLLWEWLTVGLQASWMVNGKLGCWKVPNLYISIVDYDWCYQTNHKIEYLFWSDYSATFYGPWFLSYSKRLTSRTQTLLNFEISGLFWFMETPVKGH
jgi:hypothetical protein